MTILKDKLQYYQSGDYPSIDIVYTCGCYFINLFRIILYILISFAFSFILIFLVVILPVKSLDKDDIIYNLSGGQKQRTAIARTLVNDPKIILADEPTGTLDSKNASLIMYVFKEFNNSGKTIIMVTHDNDVAKVCKNSL